MKKLTFYYQKRRDGGLRTGVEVDDERLLEDFEPGGEPEDSRLLWFVDVRSVGNKLPSQPKAVRDWLLRNSQEVKSALRGLAEEVRTGIDSDWPVKKDIPGPPGTKTAIYCSAMRRADGREIAKVISELQQNWDNIIKRLPSNDHILH